MTGAPDLPGLTLDMNSVIDLEEGRPEAPFLQQLIRFADSERILIQVAAIGASERMPGGSYAETFAAFQEKLQRVGLGGARLLPPIGYYGITFYGRCVYADEAASQLEREIHDILFPNIPFLYSDLEAASPSISYEDWRNAKCDVLHMWCHINEGGGIFVTRDTDFTDGDNGERLAQLGAGRILSPREAVEAITGLDAARRS